MIFASHSLHVSLGYVQFEKNLPCRNAVRAPAFPAADTGVCALEGMLTTELTSHLSPAAEIPRGDDCTLPGMSGNVREGGCFLQRLGKATGMWEVGGGAGHLATPRKGASYIPSLPDGPLGQELMDKDVTVEFSV